MENLDTSQPETEAKPRSRRNGNGGPTEHDMLAACGFENLPEVFTMQTEAGPVREREPAYELEAPCFLGQGREARLWEEGSIIVTEQAPNDVMKPLNRAAGLNAAQQRASLPAAGAAVDISDISEAAQMLSGDPDIMKRPKHEIEEMIAHLAVKLRMKREGKDFRNIPQASPHNFTGKNTPSAPPLLGAKQHNLSGAESTFAAYGQRFRAEPGSMVPQVRSMPQGGRR